MFYKIENDYLTAEINDAGAELHSLYSKENGFEYLWQGNPDIWYGQSPVLFPIIGRLLDDKYRYNGKEYTMQKHGFARKMTFDVVSCERNTAVFVLKSNEATLSQYPFEFELYVKFELLGKTLQATHTVVNKTDGEMYFSLGGHPGFNCEIGDWLMFDKNETLSTETIDSDSIRLAEKTPVLNDEKKIVITKDIFNNDALILSGIKSRAITLGSDNHDRRVRFTFGDVPYLGIWAKPGAPYVCIEPWCGVNDDRKERADISEKDAIMRLPKGGIFDLIYTAEII
ncbi:MAG: aldose 1-epimerase family protein [Clostridia bacterium]|nr:aldose 1-epimerase family protein [Clostridia bacterium]